jgi:hypothetical protein
MPIEKLLKYKLNIFEIGGGAVHFLPLWHESPKTDTL